MMNVIFAKLFNELMIFAYFQINQLKQPASNSPTDINPVKSSSESLLTHISNDQSTNGVKNIFTDIKKSHVSYSLDDDPNKLFKLPLDGVAQINNSQFFEVMYVGMLKLSQQENVQVQFDDAISTLKIFFEHDSRKFVSRQE